MFQVFSPSSSALVGLVLLVSPSWQSSPGLVPSTARTPICPILYGEFVCCLLPLHLYVLFYTVSLSVVYCPYTYMSYFIRWVCLLSTAPTPICPILYGEFVCCLLPLHLYVLFYTVSLSVVYCPYTYMSYFIWWVCLPSTAFTPICPTLYGEFVCCQLLLHIYVTYRKKGTVGYFE